VEICAANPGKAPPISALLSPIETHSKTRPWKEPELKTLRAKVAELIEPSAWSKAAIAFFAEAFTLTAP